MINTHRTFPDERFKPWQYADFYEIETILGAYVVSMATAAHVDRCLETYSDHLWIEFHDLSGTRHRVQARYVMRITAAD